MLNSTPNINEEVLIEVDAPNCSLDLSTPTCLQTLELNTSIFDSLPLSYSTLLSPASIEESSITVGSSINNNIPSLPTSTSGMNVTKNVSGVKIKARRRLFNVKPRSILLTPVAQSIYTSAKKFSESTTRLRQTWKGEIIISVLTTFTLTEFIYVEENFE